VPGFRLVFTNRALAAHSNLVQDAGLVKRRKAVDKAPGHLEINPHYLSLNTHKFVSLAGPKGEDIFESYAENNTPSAYRIFWYYGPSSGEITIVAITQHP
jgi:hypothetical protein